MIPEDAVEAAVKAWDHYWGDRYGDEALEEMGNEVRVALEAAAPFLGREARTDVPALLDENARLRAALDAVNALHPPIRVYDECQCPEGTHPGEYEYIDCYSYAGCENTFTHWACEECCTDGGRDYISERCADSHRHDKDEAHRCPTVQAIEASE